MGWHKECYDANHPRPAKLGFPARYESACEAGEKCTKGGRINPGQSFTWQRKGKGYFAGEPAESTAPNPTPSPNVGAADSSIAAALAAVLLPAVQAQIDAKLGAVDPESILAEVDALISAKVAECNIPRRIEVVTPKGEVNDVGVQHKQFSVLLKALSAKCNVWLAGPSGSGKTTAAHNAAKALGLEFRFTGAISDPYALTGYNDAQGRYVRTPFREAWEHGGVFLWDEVDASDPTALLAFNAALANGSAAFPDSIVPRHPECVIIAAANTFGHGATHEYVGRMKLDMAFLKRFAFIQWEYDEELERATAPNPTWTKRVQAIRKKVAAKGLRVLVTPRESYIGGALLEAGIDQDMVECMTIRSGMTEEQWNQVRA